MTVLPLIPRGEVLPRSQAVARRLRALLAEEQIPAIEVARQLGLSQSKFARRITGDTPLSLDEIDQICDVLGIQFEWLTTGEGPKFDPDNDPSAGAPTRARTWDLRIKSP